MSSKDKISLVLVEAKHSKEDLSFLLKKTDQAMFSFVVAYFGKTLSNLSFHTYFLLSKFGTRLGAGLSFSAVSINHFTLELWRRKRLEI